MFLRTSQSQKPEDSWRASLLRVSAITPKFRFHVAAPCGTATIRRTRRLQSKPLGIVPGCCQPSSLIVAQKFLVSTKKCILGKKYLMKSLPPHETLSENPLIPQNRLQERVSELGGEISADYVDGGLMLVAILRGAFVFAADLLRAITIPAAIDFIAISSYAGQAGVVRITKDLE